MHKEKESFCITVLFLFFWILFTLYPQPSKLFISVYRLLNHPIDPYSREVQYLLSASDLMSASDVERFVITAIPYQYDWETYRLPWYFPTVKEVFQNQAGDCKARMIVISSMLEAKEIEHRILASPTHIWVDYDGRPETSSENHSIAFMTFEDGFIVRTPSYRLVNFNQSFWTAFWDHMPRDKKIVLCVGFILSLWMSVPLSKKRLCIKLEKE